MCLLCAPLLVCYNVSDKEKITTLSYLRSGLSLNISSSLDLNASILPTYPEWRSVSYLSLNRSRCFSSNERFVIELNSKLI